MKAKVTILLILLLILLTGLFLRNTRKSSQEVSGSVTAYFHLYTSPAEEVLNRILMDFGDFYPGIDLEYHIEPYQDLRKSLRAELETEDTDYAIVSVLTAEDLEALDPSSTVPSPWISSAWGLYYNKSRLLEAGYGRAELTTLGQEGLEVFCTSLEGSLEEGETLFALGADFYWPWLAWVQHLQLLSSRGRSPEALGIQDWSMGITLWDELVHRAYFNDDYRTSNWAGSHLAVSRGEALFVLSDASLYSTYLPSERSEIESIPFPGSSSQGWQSGSNLYLASLFGEETGEGDQEAASILISYLRSEGIQQSFLEETGIRLLGFETGTALEEIPSITQKTRDPAMQDLLKYLMNN